MGTSSIRHPAAPGRTAPPAQLLWPTGFLFGWSVGLEFPAGQLAESDYWREQFQTISETFLFAAYWCIQRIRGFTMMHYINRLFTWLVTYLCLLAECGIWELLFYQAADHTKSPFTRPHLSSGSFWSDARELDWAAVATCHAPSSDIEGPRLPPWPTVNWAARWHGYNNGNVEVHGVWNVSDSDQQCKSHVLSDWRLWGRV